MARIRDLFRNGNGPGEIENEDAPMSELQQYITQGDHYEQLEQDMSILEDERDSKRLHKEAAREVVRSAEDSIRKLHVIKMGRCPHCSAHLRRHLFASICENCGWHTYDTPKSGPVRVHLRNSGEVIQGDRSYAVGGGNVLVLRGEMVVAKLSAHAIAWIEYCWSDEEVDQQHRHLVQRMQISCGWCEGVAEPEKEGFHMVHIAFGNSQERYCFCCDDCYEAFRKMYPARVHRNCYERNCAECNLCNKRYDDEAQGMNFLAKDYLAFRSNKGAAKGTAK